MRLVDSMLAVDAQQHARTGRRLTRGCGCTRSTQIRERGARFTSAARQASARRHAGGQRRGHDGEGLLRGGACRCRSCSDGRPGVDHRTEELHDCWVVRDRRPPAVEYPQHDCAETGYTGTEYPLHECGRLSASTIRHAYFAIGAALSAAVQWDWIKGNPATAAKDPRQRVPQPNHLPSKRPFASLAQPGSATRMGTLVWLVMVTGLRRAEFLALSWLDLSHKLTRDVPYDLDTVNHRYSKMCRRLGIDSYLHALQHRAHRKYCRTDLGGYSNADVVSGSRRAQSGEGQVASVVSSRLGLPDREVP